MNFKIDKVSEDSFFENLLLGITKLLENSLCVSRSQLVRLPPASQQQIRSWENENNTILPEDLKSFYLSSNGFSFTYYFESDFANEQGHVGGIYINSVNNLKKMPLSENLSGPLGEQPAECKLFELVTLGNEKSVVLNYMYNPIKPSIWLICRPSKQYFLAPDFTTYFRMSLAHLGVPNWQLIVTEDGIGDWAREIFHIVAPGALRDDSKLAELNECHDNCLNIINPSIFLPPKDDKRISVDPKKRNKK